MIKMVEILGQINISIWYILGFIFLVIFGFGVRIVRPVERGLIETLGKFSRTAEQGFTWIIPFIQRMVKVNITEVRVDIPPQEVITKDKLNAKVDAVVYYRVRDAKKAISMPIMKAIASPVTLYSFRNSINSFFIPILLN